jgi:hypothetical protein
MNRRYSLISYVLFAVVLWPFAESSAQSGQHPVLDAPGFREHRDYFSEIVSTILGRATTALCQGGLQALIQF